EDRPAAFERRHFGIARQRQGLVRRRYARLSVGNQGSPADFIVIEPVDRLVSDLADGERRAQDDGIVGGGAMGRTRRSSGRAGSAASRSQTSSQQQRGQNRCNPVNAKSHLQAIPRTKRSSSSSYIRG